ncbi:MAG: PD-(D/E)XK nuclease family protein [Actinomycetes bacterium]|nr:PD-(D/E)XK nuclease family protein [Actinomycetes bacterium]MDX5380658.1 PD-(D/E)XK nuclease family protein [Actinomycetes bacterium]MDX5399613.1 PD-(D/E)XK nuclease family protein [Actinomycetes bacterium]MDX5450401.1 PD-(D/E)XK nuclease family protein [Actinomycetes bacterium]
MRRAAMSPSRVKDFQQCPLKFRYRTVDRLPEPPSSAALRGTLVHAVLERLYDLPAAGRTEDAAHALVDPQWAALVARDPDLLRLFSSQEDLASWLAQGRALVSNYFRMENPRRLEPAARERLVEVEIGDGILLRGYIDRVDRAATGAIRLVDYKTGKSPSERFSAEALFQMRFYALMIWRLEGTPPARLQLVYLGDGRTLTLDPHPEDLISFEAELTGLWERIEASARTGDFPARRSALCPWCSFQPLCPAFGGDVPPVPGDGISALLGVRRPATAGG